jgi:hypothetical protein
VQQSQKKKNREIRKPKRERMCVRERRENSGEEDGEEKKNRRERSVRV